MHRGMDFGTIGGRVRILKFTAATCEIEFWWTMKSRFRPPGSARCARAMWGIQGRRGEKNWIDFAGACISRLMPRALIVGVRLRYRVDSLGIGTAIIFRCPSEIHRDKSPLAILCDSNAVSHSVWSRERNKSDEEWSGWWRIPFRLNAKNHMKMAKFEHHMRNAAFFLFNGGDSDAPATLDSQKREVGAPFSSLNTRLARAPALAHPPFPEKRRSILIALVRPIFRHWRFDVTYASDDITVEVGGKTGDRGLRIFFFHQLIKYSIL